MNFYSNCIAVPAVVGVVMYLLRGSHQNVDTDPYLPLYSVFMAMWAVLFLVVSELREGRGNPGGSPCDHGELKGSCFVD